MRTSTHTVFHTLFTFAPHKMASALISSHSQESLHFGSLQRLLIKQTQQRGTTGLMQQGISLVPLGTDILPGSDVIKAKSTAVKTAPSTFFTTNHHRNFPFAKLIKSRKKAGLGEKEMAECAEVFSFPHKPVRPHSGASGSRLCTPEAPYRLQYEGQRDRQ